MKQKKRTINIQVWVSANERRAIEDFQFRERIPTRSAAVRELLRRGLTEDGQEISN